MGEHELILDANELESIVFECGACGCRFGVSAKPEAMIQPQSECCLGCGAHLPELQNTYWTYKKFFQLVTTVGKGHGATAAGFKVKFRVSLPGKPASA